jgi:ketosteroid isomerase-like protein
MLNPNKPRHFYPFARSRTQVSSNSSLGCSLLLLAAALTCALPLSAQNSPAPAPSGPSLDSLAKPQGPIASPITQPTLSPGVLLLMELEGRFAQAVATGGGKAFASWFADDAVTLNNGRPAVLGRANIAAGAQWDPKTYQLTWIPQGAQMGPSNDMGFTWGHYEGRWKKLPDGTWKVAMDASADEPPETGECCVLPKP